MLSLDDYRPHSNLHNLGAMAVKPEDDGCKATIGARGCRDGKSRLHTISELHLSGKVPLECVCIINEPCHICPCPCNLSNFSKSVLEISVIYDTAFK